MRLYLTIFCALIAFGILRAVLEKRRREERRRRMLAHLRATLGA
jgi:hypothetical protein